MQAKWLTSMMLGVVVACPMGASAAMGAKYTLHVRPDYTPSEWTRSVGYTERAKGKFLFGGKNAVLGWAELYNEPREAAREETGVMQGMGRGVAHMLGDTVGGVAHLVTFPITAVDVILPEGGTDVL
jgi:hypothetical protein